MKSDPGHGTDKGDVGPHQWLRALEEPLSPEAEARNWDDVCRRLEAEDAHSERDIGAKPVSARIAAGEDPLDSPARRATDRAGEWLIRAAVLFAAALGFAVLLDLFPENGNEQVSGEAQPIVAGPGEGEGEGGEDGQKETVRIQALIEKLAAEDFAERRKAFRALLAGGGKARAALRSFRAKGDVEQDRAVRDLLQGHGILGRLKEHSDTGSLAFWRELWRIEAEHQPFLWSIGLRLGMPGGGSAVPAPDLKAPPHYVLKEALDVGFGPEKGGEIARRFRFAFEALKEFQKWKRKKLGASVEDPAQTDRLQAVAKAGVAAAPVVLQVLEAPLANVINSEQKRIRLRDAEAGRVLSLPYSLDHLRMIVAAERMKLKAAEPVLMRRFVAGYPLSVTIQMHAIAALWRMGGRHDAAPHFPFAVGFPEPEDVAKVQRWWLCPRVLRLGSDSFEERESATEELIRLGPGIRERMAEFAKEEKEPEIRLRCGRILRAIKDPSQTALTVLRVLETSRVKVLRPGSRLRKRFSGIGFAWHLRGKALLKGFSLAGSAEEFITRMATTSSSHGQPYHVRLEDGTERPLNEWLKGRLSMWTPAGEGQGEPDGTRTGDTRDAAPAP